MPTYRTEGVILKRQDFKEYDRYLTVYTEKRGKIEIVARGIRKIQSKLAGHLEPFNIVDLMVARGKYYDRVAGSMMLENFEHLKSNLEGIALANYFNEAVDLLTRSHQSDQNTFILIRNVYQSINRYLRKNGEKSDIKDQFLIVLSFVLRLVSLQGFQPSFKHCFYCKKNVKEEKNSFSFSHLSVVCPSCRNQERNLEEVSPIVLKMIRIMTLENFPSLKINNLSYSTFYEIQNFINKMLMAVGERKINSFNLLQDLVKVSNM